MLLFWILGWWRRTTWFLCHWN